MSINEPSPLIKLVVRVLKKFSVPSGMIVLPITLISITKILRELHVNRPIDAPHLAWWCWLWKTSTIIQGYTMHWHAEITPDELKEDETIRLQFIETARVLRDTNKRFI